MRTTLKFFLIAPYIFVACMNAMKKEILRISHIKEFLNEKGFFRYGVSH